jgi:hypothetical protein
MVLSISFMLVMNPPPRYVSVLGTSLTVLTDQYLEPRDLFEMPLISFNSCESAFLFNLEKVPWSLESQIDMQAHPALCALIILLLRNP